MGDQPENINDKDGRKNLDLLYDLSLYRLLGFKDDIKIMDNRFALVLSAVAFSILVATGNNQWGFWSFHAASKFLFALLAVVSLVASLWGMVAGRWQYGVSVEKVLKGNLHIVYDNHLFKGGMTKEFEASYMHNKGVIRKKSNLFMVAFGSATGLVIIVVIELLTRSNI